MQVRGEGGEEREEIVPVVDRESLDAYSISSFSGSPP